MTSTDAMMGSFHMPEPLIDTSTRLPEPANQNGTVHYPAASVQGTSWMLDALDDLAACASYFRMPDVARELRDVRISLTARLQDNSPEPEQKLP
ncbi:hypothetical protein [Pseudooceanicola sp. MF1-13]|uniref:hypothetical protein n=1 Tax=Pseudooceanicola sp. MF1-13 TaxID=3379095 RepID=UPI003891C283